MHGCSYLEESKNKFFSDHSFSSVLYHISINVIFFIISCVGVTSALFGLSKLLEWKGLTMLWFSSQWFAITYYGLAVLYVTTTVLKLRPFLLSVRSIFSSHLLVLSAVCNRVVWLQSKLSDENEAKLFIIIPQTVITLLFAFGVFVPLRSVYLIGINLAVLSVSLLLLNSFLFRKLTGIVFFLGKKSFKMVVNYITGSTYYLHPLISD